MFILNWIILGNLEASIWSSMLLRLYDEFGIIQDLISKQESGDFFCEQDILESL